MSTTRTTNGTIKLTSLAELGTVLDLASLPDAPGGERQEHESSNSQPAPTDPSASPVLEPQSATELADVIAKLATMSGGLDAVAREDARAREEATLDLARYEALVAEIADAERSLAEARRVRASAQALAEQAFSEHARITAAQHVATSRALALRCMELLAERRRDAQALAGCPQLARILEERQRQADEQAQAARAAEIERAERLDKGLCDMDAALNANDLDAASAHVEVLATEFADHAEVRRRLDIVRWRLRNRLVAPAEAVLRDIARRAYRDDPEAALARLAEVQTEGLPEDLARRVFGIWSNTCWQVVQLRGWQDPRRESPGTSRGAVWAKTPDGVYQVVSSLEDPTWRPGQVVPETLALRAPALRGDSARNRHNGPAA